MAMGDDLVKKGVITAAQLVEALTEQAQTKDRLGTILVNKGFATQAAIDAAL